MGVYELRHSDAHSRDIFFVAACRSMGIPSYMDNATDQIFVAPDGEWTEVSFAEGGKAEKESDGQSSLTVKLSSNQPIADPQYWKHYTIERYEDGDFVSLDYEDDERVATFPYTLTLKPGYYCLSTGNRDEKGSVRSRLEFFELREGEAKEMEVVIRDLTEGADDEVVTVDKGFEVIGGMATIEDYAGEKGFIFVSLGDYREPSKHLVKELIEKREQLERWGGMIYLLAPEGVPAMSWDIPGADVAIWRKSLDDPLEKMLVKELGISEPVVYPVVALVKGDGRVTFHSNGYKIGVVEQMLRQL